MAENPHGVSKHHRRLTGSVWHALRRFNDDKDAYFERIRECVSLSVDFRLAPPQDENCSLVFSEPPQEYLQIVRRNLYAATEDEHLEKGDRAQEVEQQEMT